MGDARGINSQRPEPTRRVGEVDSEGVHHWIDFLPSGIGLNTGAYYMPLYSCWDSWRMLLMYMYTYIRTYGLHSHVGCVVKEANFNGRAHPTSHRKQIGQFKHFGKRRQGRPWDNPEPPLSPLSPLSGPVSGPPREPHSRDCAVILDKCHASPCQSMPSPCQSGY